MEKLKKRLPLLVVIIILLLAIGGGIAVYMMNRTHFNDDYVNSNTPGNLYNDGLICEYGDLIYFANPSDRDRLYCMNADGSNLTKICDDTVSYINVDEHYIYYVRNNPGTGDAFSFLNFNTDSLCRINRDGRADSVLVLDSAPSLYASLVGNYIYFLHYSDSAGSLLYKVKIDGSELTQIAESPFFTCSTSGQYIYYNGIETEHYLWRLNAEDDTTGMLYGGNCWMPTVVDDTTVYYMDCDSRYAIARADIETGEKVILAPDRVDCYNVCGDYIYFQRNDSETPALCRMRTDGSDYEVIVEGIHNKINTTSEHVYFRDYTTGQTYRVPHDNIDQLELFLPGAVTEDE